MHEDSQKLTSKLLSAVQTVNEIDEATLLRIAKHVCQQLPFLPHHQAFSPADESLKLNKELLPDDETNIKTMVSALSYIFLQVAFNVMKPVTVSNYLNKLGIKEASSLVISNLWMVHAKSVILALKKENLSSFKAESVDSSIHYRLSSLTQRHSKVPVALIHVSCSKIIPRTTTPISLLFEFTHEELFNFHELLEDIQSQLDKIM